jgi:hypothetical protein
MQVIRFIYMATAEDQTHHWDVIRTTWIDLRDQNATLNGTHIDLGHGNI